MTSDPLFHFVPESGWMNDPNGLIEKDGVHHLFFQHNPASTAFADMHWGHATSRDLLRWTQQPTALVPGDSGDYDKDGCWSGCAIPLPDGKVAVLYSGNAGARQLPALAYALDDDLTVWEKSPANPVIAQRPPLEGLTDLRDHAVLREGDRWRQVLAAGSDPTQGGIRGAGGWLVSYLSDGDDLASWRFDGVLLGARDAGLPGDVFECPDVFAAPGCADGEVVVVLSWYEKEVAGEPPVASDVLWLTGALEAGRFMPRRYGRADLGNRFYAPLSYSTSDGRRLQFGWLRTHEDPASVGRAHLGAQSLPRELTVVDGRLRQEPARELERLTRTQVGCIAGGGEPLQLPEPAVAVEVRVAARPADLPAAVVALASPSGHRTEVPLAPFAAATTYVRAGGVWQAEPVVPRAARVLVDAGIVEVFTDDGRAAATSDLALETVARVSLLGPSEASAEVASLSLPA